MKDYYMKQCDLVKSGPGHSAIITSWIPEKFAKKGNFLQVKMEGEWNNGWRVGKVGKIRRLASMVDERSQDYKHTREASDI